MLPGFVSHAFNRALQSSVLTDACQIRHAVFKSSRQASNLARKSHNVLDTVTHQGLLNQTLSRRVHSSCRDLAAAAEPKRLPENAVRSVQLRCPDPFAWRKSQYTKTFTPRALRTRYELFYDSAEEIFDSDHSTWVEIDSETGATETDADEHDDESEFANLNMERAEAGVFTVDELVEVLEQENMCDICCIAVPPEREYADYLIIASGNSLKHLFGTEEFIYRYYKRKKAEWDPFVLREGKKTNWTVMDFGNIVLHMMLPEVRQIYDVERLWAVGFKYDEQESVSKPEWMSFLDQLEVVPVPLNNQLPNTSRRKPRRQSNLTALSVLQFCRVIRRKVKLLRILK